MSVLVVVVGATLMEAEDIPPLLRLTVEADTTVAQLCALAADMLGLTDANMDPLSQSPPSSTLDTTLSSERPSSRASLPLPSPLTSPSPSVRWQFTVRTVPAHSGAVPELLKEERTLSTLCSRTRHVSIQLSIGPRGAAAVRARVASSVRGVAARVLADLQSAREELRLTRLRAEAELSALSQQRNVLEQERAALGARAEDTRKERAGLRAQLSEAHKERARRETQLREQEARAAQHAIKTQTNTPNKEGGQHGTKLSEEQLLSRHVTASDKDEAEKLFRTQLSALRRQIATLRAESVSERAKSVELIAKREAEVRAKKALSDEAARQESELRRALAAVSLAIERTKETLRSVEERNHDLRVSVTHLKLEQVSIAEQVSTAESTLREASSARGAVRALSPRSAKPRVSVSVPSGQKNAPALPTLPPARPRQPLPATLEFESTMEELSGLIASTLRDVELEAVIAAATPRSEHEEVTAELLAPEGSALPAAWDESFWSDITGQ